MLLHYLYVEIEKAQIESLGCVINLNFFTNVRLVRCQNRTDNKLQKQVPLYQNSEAKVRRCYRKKVFPSFFFHLTRNAQLSLH